MSEPTVWTVTIDDETAVVTGTRRGDPRIERLLPRPWVWGRGAGGYVLPRSMKPLTRTYRVDALLAAAPAADVTVEVEDLREGAQSEADRRAARAQRLDERADRHEEAAERATARSEAEEAAYRLISDHLPPGQPILEDHYSAPRHRKLLEKMNRHHQESAEAERQAHRRASLAAGIRRTLDNGDSPVTIRLRIDRNQAEVRRLDRTLFRTDRQSEAYARWTVERDRLAEAVEIDQATLAQMEADGKTKTYTAAHLAKGDYVFGVGFWHEVLRVNRTTVTVPSIVGGDWTDKLPLAKVTNHRTAAEVAATRTTQQQEEVTTP